MGELWEILFDILSEPRHSFKFGSVHAEGLRVDEKEPVPVTGFIQPSHCDVPHVYRLLCPNVTKAGITESLMSILKHGSGLQHFLAYVSRNAGLWHNSSSPREASSEPDPDFPKPRRSGRTGEDLLAGRVLRMRFPGPDISGTLPALAQAGVHIRQAMETTFSSEDYFSQ
ncbi:hypothetical protein RRG08_054095 [Elysia crispata]|uniref:Uncharacterized protein n=1 Tax=Elysia crispata TaxID=231223 RepID=A0AAE0ZCV5_9GAST|nr:hypothetical protein RRG08_054095 [Elysia crispata]